MSSSDDDVPRVVTSAFAVLGAPVDEVTVLEDRAHVVRRGTATLGPGLNRLRVTAVAPVLVDRTLIARLEDGDEHVRVVDARVRRAWVADDATPAAPAGSQAALARRRDELDDELARLGAERAVGETSAAGLGELARALLGDIAADAAHGREPPAGALASFRELSRRRRDERVRLLDLDERRRDLEQERERLAQRYRTGRAVERLEASIEIDILADDAGEHRLRLDYLVPNACWRPQHRAELGAGPPATVRFETEACLWQRTGEDWIEVALAFSTERATLGTEPPELDSDVLGVQRKSERIEVQVRDQRIEPAVAAAAGRAALELPGVDDGGEPMCLSSTGRFTVPSDGRPHRIPLAALTSEAETELVSMPELAAAVLLKSVQHNRGAHPLLAGPVDLVREAGLCGRASIMFVGRGERFELGWGPEPDLRVSRTVEEHHEPASMLGSWSTHARRVELLLSNLGGERRRLRLRERVPVSEIEKVRVLPDPKHSTDRRSPDEDGFVDWELELEPFGHAAVELRYRLETHQDVVGV